MSKTHQDASLDQTNRERDPGYIPAEHLTEARRQELLAKLAATPHTSLEELADIHAELLGEPPAPREERGNLRNLGGEPAQPDA